MTGPDDEAARLAEVRKAAAGTGAITGTGTGADARYLVDGQWLDYAAAKAAGRLPEGEDAPAAGPAREVNLVPAEVLELALRRVAEVQAGQAEAAEDENDGCE